MPRAGIGVSGSLTRAGDESRVAATLANPSSQVAFFLSVEITEGSDGDEALPMTYDDNYVTVFPKESQTLWARFRVADLEGARPHLRVEGYNVDKRISATE